MRPSTKSMSTAQRRAGQARRRGSEERDRVPAGGKSPWRHAQGGLRLLFFATDREAQARACPRQRQARRLRRGSDAKRVPAADTLRQTKEGAAQHRDPSPRGRASLPAQVPPLHVSPVAVRSLPPAPLRPRPRRRRLDVRRRRAAPRKRGQPPANAPGLKMFGRAAIGRRQRRLGSDTAQRGSGGLDEAGDRAAGE